MCITGAFGVGLSGCGEWKKGGNKDLWRVLVKIEGWRGYKKKRQALVACRGYDLIIMLSIIFYAGYQRFEN